jgi:hypothetical protein
MSKTKRRKKSRSRASGGSVAVQERVERAVPAASSRRALASRRPSLQNAVFAFMLTLGFLGFAIFFTFFYSEDANHYLYGGAMGLTALGWLALAARRWSAYRQYVQA